ncbi:hypothetical protein D3C85_512020 [compost metagenome]
MRQVEVLVCASSFVEYRRVRAVIVRVLYHCHCITNTIQVGVCDEYVNVRIGNIRYQLNRCRCGRLGAIRYYVICRCQVYALGRNNNRSYVDNVLVQLECNGVITRSCAKHFIEGLVVVERQGRTLNRCNTFVTCNTHYTDIAAASSISLFEAFYQCRSIRNTVCIYRAAKQQLNRVSINCYRFHVWAVKGRTEQENALCSRRVRVISKNQAAVLELSQNTGQVWIVVLHVGFLLVLFTVLVIQVQELIPSLPGG